jgi:hypothetical protein
MGTPCESDAAVSNGDLYDAGADGASTSRSSASRYGFLSIASSVARRLCVSTSSSRALRSARGFPTGSGLSSNMPPMSDAGSDSEDVARSATKFSAAPGAESAREPDSASKSPLAYAASALTRCSSMPSDALPMDEPEKRRRGGVVREGVRANCAHGNGAFARLDAPATGPTVSLSSVRIPSTVTLRSSA